MLDNDADRGGWEVAQICENGHVVNAYSLSMPQYNQSFCSVVSPFEIWV